MKKVILIILAVAILGVVGVYSKNQEDSQQAAANPSPSSSSAHTGTYKDGTYSGSSAETPYGPVQVSAIVTDGKITNILFDDMPDDDARSSQITADSKEPLKQAAIVTQNADIDFVTGATSTSFGYQESLQAALDQARMN